MQTETSHRDDAASSLERAAGTFPLVVQAPAPGAVLEESLLHDRESLDRALLRHGAVLFRGFDVTTPARFESVSNVLCGPLLEYVYRSTPRTSVGRNVYTATEYRPDAAIPLHNENAYQRDWPMKLAFNCQRPAASGGHTPLARAAAVRARLDPSFVRDYASKGVMYVRNFGQGVDLPWQVAFQTESRPQVEAYCERHGIEWEWLDDDRLRTRQICQAVARHPVTHAELWFNQAHLFHVSSLGPEQRRAMLQVFDEPDLPRNAYWGDGTQIDEDILDHIRDAYERETVTFPWEAGDVLLVDNMLVAHGRRPYTGARTVLVAMGDAFSRHAAEIGPPRA